MNGALQPVLSLPRGGLTRLRIVNACASRYLRLAVEGHTACTLRVTPATEVVIVRGDRVEVLARGDKGPGDYRLMTRRTSAAAAWA